MQKHASTRRCGVDGSIVNFWYTKKAKNEMVRKGRVLLLEEY